VGDFVTKCWAHYIWSTQQRGHQEPDCRTEFSTCGAGKLKIRSTKKIRLLKFAWKG